MSAPRTAPEDHSPGELFCRAVRAEIVSVSDGLTVDQAARLVKVTEDLWGMYLEFLGGRLPKSVFVRRTRHAYNALAQIAGAPTCEDRKSTRLNSSHSQQSRMPSSA